MDRRREHRSESREAGFTLIELMVAIGLFAVLMALVSVFLITGLRSLKEASTANSIQAQQQNAMIVMSRDIRYIDNPVERATSLPAILKASPDTFVFFTRSGTGEVDRLAYKVVLCTSDLGVESFSWAPALVDGAAVENTSPDLSVPTCDDAGATGSLRRTLVAKEKVTDPTVTFRYFSGADELLPDLDGATGLPTELSADQLSALTSVQISLTDPSLGAPLEQSVLLVNER